MYKVLTYLPRYCLQVNLLGAQGGPPALTPTLTLILRAIGLLAAAALAA